MAAKLRPPAAPAPQVINGEWRIFMPLPIDDSRQEPCPSSLHQFWTAEFAQALASDGVQGRVREHAGPPEARTDDYITLTAGLGLKYRAAKKENKKPLLELKFLRPPKDLASSTENVEDWKKVLKAKLKSAPETMEQLVVQLRRLEKECPQLHRCIEILEREAVRLPESALRQLPSAGPPLPKLRPTTVRVGKVRRQAEVGRVVLELAELEIQFPEAAEGVRDKKLAYQSICVEGPINLEAIKVFRQRVLDVVQKTQGAVDSQEVLVAGYPEFLLWLQAKLGVGSRPPGDAEQQQQQAEAASVGEDVQTPVK